MRAASRRAGSRWAAILLVCAVAVSGAVGAGCQSPLQKDDRLENPVRSLGKRATVVVTTDGGKDLVVKRTIPIERHTTALEALRFVADVRLGPGDVVEQVNGLGGGALTAMGPDPSAWFYRINGVEGTADPAKFKVPRGALLWWDLRRYDIYRKLPVAVGAFPDALLLGYRENVRPLQISHGKGFSDDAEFFRRTIFNEFEPKVRSLDADADLIGGGRDSPRPKSAVREDRANFVIARWEEARLDPYVIDIGTSPREYGLTVWIEGTDIRRQNPDEEFSRELNDAEGVVWATTVDGEPDSAVVYMVTGITDEGVRAAARALKEGKLQFSLAAAVDRDGNLIP